MTPLLFVLFRENYMAARRYEISLQVYVEEYFKSERSARAKYFSIREEKFRIFNPKPLHFRCRESRHLLCSHSNGDLYTCEDNMLFSSVEMSWFRAKAHLVFHWFLNDKWSHYKFSDIAWETVACRFTALPLWNFLFFFVCEPKMELDISYANVFGLRRVARLDFWIPYLLE